MKPGLIIILFILILVPLVLFFILGLGMVNQEQEYVKEKFRMVLVSRLEDISLRIREIVAGLERSFLGMNEIGTMNTEELRGFVRRNRMVRQVFILGRDNQLLHPPGDDSQTEKEQNFFKRTESIWMDRESFFRPWEDAFHRIRNHGWYTWFWGRGVNMIFWSRDHEERIIGIEVDGTALVADIIGRLPDSSQISPELAGGRIVLADISDDVIYQWGAYQPAEAEVPLVRVAVAAPLTGWGLAYFSASGEWDSLFQQNTLVNLIAVAVLVFVLLAVMAAYFYRENTRAIRDAARKVSFVNQVSHELKTPLTNIRLYAELLAGRISPDDERLHRYLAVVVSESQRLSRLILNVLTFAGEQKKQIRLHKSTGIIDDAIRGVIENFRQPFSVAGIRVNFSGTAEKAVSFDEDVLGQILGNLFSNVEKYAAGGKEITIVSRLDNGLAMITVSDRGPGIPKNQQAGIFRPFVRLSNKLSDGVTGTGLGLTIARKLAQAHGGDLMIDPAAAGASFTVTLDVREKEMSDENNDR